LLLFGQHSTSGERPPPIDQTDRGWTGSSQVQDREVPRVTARGVFLKIAGTADFVTGSAERSSLPRADQGPIAVGGTGRAGVAPGYGDGSSGTDELRRPPRPRPARLSV